MMIDQDEQLIVESAKNGSSRLLEVFAHKVLNQHYPKWNWRVIKLRTLTGKNTTRHVVRGGGEILERFNMRRGGTDWLGKYYLPKADPMGLEVAGGDHSERIF